MVAYTHHFMESPRAARSLNRWLLRVVGMACLFAIPGLWLFIPQGLPETRILGLAFTVMLIGASGLCFAGRR